MAGEDLGADWGNDPTPAGNGTRRKSYRSREVGDLDNYLRTGRAPAGEDLGADWGSDAVPVAAKPAAAPAAPPPGGAVGSLLTNPGLAGLYLKSDPKGFVRNALQEGRDVASGALALGEAGARWAGQKISEGARALYPAASLGMDRDPVAEQGFVPALQHAWENRNTGWRTMGNNPVNIAGTAALMVPGAGQVLGPNLLARAAAIAGGNAAVGAGTGASEALLQGKDQDIARDAEIGGLVGLGGGVAGELLRGFGASRFPGLSRAANPKVTPAAKDMVRTELDNILSKGVLPKNRESLLDVATKMREQAGSRYESAVGAVDPAWTVPLEQMEKDAREKLLDRLADPYRMAAEYDEALGRAVLPDEADKQIGSKFKSMRATLVSRAAEADPERAAWGLANARDITAARTAGSNPVMYQAPTGAAQMMAKDVGSSFRDAMTDALMSNPDYAAALGPDAAKQYALSKNLEKVITSPGRVGLQHRLPILNFSVDPWWLSSAAYKTGSAADRLVLPIARGIMGRAIAGDSTRRSGK